MKLILHGSRRETLRRSADALMLLIVMACTAASAENVTLFIRAINPSLTETQKVQVSSYLPKPIKPADVLDAGNFEITYDIHKDQYLLRGEIELAPKEVRSFDVQLRDAWVVAPAEIAGYQGQAERLAAALKGAECAETAKEVQAAVTKNCAFLLERQNANAVGTGKILEHIRAFESNVELLSRIRKDVGLLENLMIGTGKDPGVLLGSAKTDLSRQMQEITPGDAVGEVVIRIRVANTSTTEKRKIPLRQDLPQEIGPDDVIDPNGLEVHVDSARRVTYVSNDAIELEPGKEQIFIVKVRNRWVLSEQRLRTLTADATNLLAIARDQKAYVSIRDLAESVIKDLDAIKAQKPPAEIDQNYVAFYREQDRRMKSLEAKILKSKELFQPRIVVNQVPENPLTILQPPSLRTTWMIIYIILGFLGVFSLLFFLRWYGKSKAERNQG